MARKPIADSGTMPVSVAAWLDELATLSRKNDAGHTCAELAEMAGVNVKTMRERLQKAAAAGRLVAGKRTARYIDGREAGVPVYRVLPARGKR